MLITGQRKTRSDFGDVLDSEANLSVAKRLWSKMSLIIKQLTMLCNLIILLHAPHKCTHAYLDKWVVVVVVVVDILLRWKTFNEQKFIWVFWAKWRHFFIFDVSKLFQLQNCGLTVLVLYMSVVSATPHPPPPRPPLHINSAVVNCFFKQIVLAIQTCYRWGPWRDEQMHQQASEFPGSTRVCIWVHLRVRMCHLNLNKTH